MSRVKNEIIGEVMCSHRSCSEMAGVFRFKGRGAGRARFAGKLYCVCPVHGRYGADASPASQEYILNEALIWGEGNKRPASTGAAPVKTNTPASSAQAPVPAAAVLAVPVLSPAPLPAPPVKPPAPRWWEAFQTIIK